jgi:hypothetical protein
MRDHMMRKLCRNMKINMLVKISNSVDTVISYGQKIRILECITLQINFDLFFLSFYHSYYKFSIINR